MAESEPRRCARCQALIPAEARWGICPRCLLDPTIPVTSIAPAGLGQGFGAEGRRFGDYELGRQIGRGGMGVVYEAFHLALRRIVALKMILESQLAMPAVRRRFAIEAEAAAKLDHPNIVPIYEVGEHQEQPYLSMKLVQGESLRQRMARGDLCVLGGEGGRTTVRLRSRQETAARLIATIARAVHHAHEHGVLHRDLKPGNILLDGDGQPHVTDFGLAKILDQGQPEGGLPSLTQSDNILGTPCYMSPEQASSQRLSASSDIYSLGVVLYELLTGQPPFKGTTPVETIRLVVEQDPKRPRTLHREIDPELDTICMKCLEKQPEARYASALALAEDLERWCRHLPIQARTAGALLRTRRWVKRNPVGAGLIASLCACLAISLGLLQMTREKQRQQELMVASVSYRLTKEIERLWSEPERPYVPVYASDLATLAGRAPRRPDPNTLNLTFGVIINEDPFGQAMKQAPWLGFLEEEMEKILHRPVVIDLRVYKVGGAVSYQTVVDEQVDFKKLGALHYVWAKRAAPGLQLVAQERRDKRAVIFARAGLNITNLSRSAGHRVGFAHTNSIISHLAKVEFVRAGILAAHLQSVQEVEARSRPSRGTARSAPASLPDDTADMEDFAHKAVLERALAGDIDVGEAPLRHFEKNRWRGKGGLVPIHEFAVAPYDVYVANAALPSEVVDAFRRTILAWNGRRPHGILPGSRDPSFKGFERVSDSDFDELRRQLTNEVARFTAGPLLTPANPR